MESGKVNPWERFFKLLYSLMGMVIRHTRTIEWLVRRLQAANDESDVLKPLRDRLAKFFPRHAALMAQDVAFMYDDEVSLALRPVLAVAQDVGSLSTYVLKQFLGDGAIGPDGIVITTPGQLPIGQVRPLHRLLGEAMPMHFPFQPSLPSEVSGLIPIPLAKLQDAGLGQDGNIIWQENLHDLIYWKWMARLHGDNEVLEAMDRILELWWKYGNILVGVAKREFRPVVVIYCAAVTDQTAPQPA